MVVPMKCDICGTELNKYAEVTFYYIDGSKQKLNLCVFFNEQYNRNQIKHKGLIADKRKMSEGNIIRVDIVGLGY